jgi:hypothetical protein
MVWVLLLVFPLGAQPKGWPSMPREAMQLLMQGDAKGSLALLRASAEAGDATSMFYVGRSLEEVQGIPHDYTQAMLWYRKAADAGLGVAAWSIGRLHEMGRGTSQDTDEAQRWYTKAAELGFRRTALTVIKIRWIPGPQDLEYEPVPDHLRNPPPHPSPDMAYLSRPAPDITSAELGTLRNAGLRGRLVWQGGDPGMFGLAARVILIAQRRVTAEMRLPVPEEGSVIFVQKGETWERMGGGGLSERSVRIHAQSPEVPWVTSVTIEMEDGGTQSTSGWVWKRP